MSTNKTVEPGHKIVTEGADGESSTALDNLTAPNSPYQAGMAPLSNGAPDGASGDADGSGNAPDSDSGESGTDGTAWAAEGNTPPESKYAEMSAADLRKLCKGRGLKSATNIKTEALIASLVEYDAKGDADGSGNAPDGDSGESGTGGNTGGAEDNTPPDSDEGEPVTVVLKNGATYRLRGKVYKKGVPAPAAPDTAERLLRTGLFVRG